MRFPAMCFPLNISSLFISVSPQRACNHLAGAQSCRVVGLVMLGGGVAGKLCDWGLTPSR